MSERPRGVLVLHGLGMRPEVTALLGRDLAKAGFDPVLNLPWSSRKGPLTSVAEDLGERLLRTFPDGVPPMNAVTHSTGGLLLRYLYGKGALPPGGRTVFLGTPHRGTIKADWFGGHWLFHLWFGKGGQDLRPGSRFLEELPPPPPDSLCLAGGRGDEQGFSPLMPGDDDMTVPVSSALLPDLPGHVEKGVFHSLLVLHPRVRKHILAFLQSGALPPDEAN